ncbi:MAG TPA: hypothetical protein VN641_16895 [Urbifossiella sp.]|nr:hypothetical protein [Urbifossiella sp.]
MIAGQFPVFEYRLEEAKQDVQSLEKRVQLLEVEAVQRATANKHPCEQLLSEVAQTRGELKAALDRLAAYESKNAALEERCQALQKLSDRGWQGWLALVGAAVALLVALIKK